MQRTWFVRFRDAARGVSLAVRQECTFAVHIPAATAAVLLGCYFGIEKTEWLSLVLCITLVVTAELLNTGLERMAKAVTGQRDDRIGAALDMGAGAVLVASLGAVVTGTMIFGPRLLQWWNSHT